MPERTREEVIEIVGALPDGLRSRICNMAEFLTDEVLYSVPIYQRPYSWSEEHVDKLIQDLLNAWERAGNYYYIGNLVIIAALRKSEWQIADGQQRLATTAMIFAFMRDKLGPRGDFLQSVLTHQKRGRLRLRPKDEEFFFKYVQTPGNFAELCGRDSVDMIESQVRMCAAAETITSALNDMSLEKLENFAKFICRAALFNVTYADEPGGAALVFATVNDSGLELSHADLLKFALLEGANMPDEKKEAAARTWEALEDELGRAEFGELLKIVPIMYTGDPIRAPGDLAAFAQYLFEHSSVERFLSDWLPRHGEALLDVEKERVDGPHGVEINRRIRCLKQLKDTNWKPLAVSLLANHAHETEKLRRFFRGIDLIAFGTLLGALRNEARETRWRRALAAEGDEAKLFHPKTGPLCLHEIDGHLTERDRILEKLDSTFKRDHKKDSEKRCLLLIRINACLPGGESLVREQGLTVEHILPTKGGGPWNAAFTRDEINVYPHLIGNWTLVQREQNQYAGVKSFADKKAVYFMPKFPIYAVTRTLEKWSEWTPREINIRGSEFKTALLQDWGI